MVFGTLNFEIFLILIEVKTNVKWNQSFWFVPKFQKEKKSTYGWFVELISCYTNCYFTMFYFDRDSEQRKIPCEMNAGTRLPGGKKKYCTLTEKLLSEAITVKWIAMLLPLISVAKHEHLQPQ